MGGFWRRRLEGGRRVGKRVGVLKEEIDERFILDISK